MPITKKRNESTEARLLLESDEPVELPPAEIEEKNVVVNFDTLKPFVHELLDALRAGAMAEPVPVMLDGSTFVVHGATRSFWVKLWHASSELTRIERAQIISCLPSTRGVQVLIADDDEYDDSDDEEDEYDVQDEDTGAEFDEDEVEENVDDNNAASPQR